PPRAGALPPRPPPPKGPPPCAPITPPTTRSPLSPLARPGPLSPTSRARPARWLPGTTWTSTSGRGPTPDTTRPGPGQTAPAHIAPGDPKMSTTRTTPRFVNATITGVFPVVGTDGYVLTADVGNAYYVPNARLWNYSVSDRLLVRSLHHLTPVCYVSY